MEAIFQAVNINKRFQLRKRSVSLGRNKYVQAVDNVSFDVKYGETFGIVGETGCGKTTLARLIMQLEKPTSGKMYFMGKDVTHLKRNQLKLFRRHVQMVFQDPYSSLNPVKSMLFTVSEPLKINKLYKDNKELIEQVRNILDLVGLPSTDEMLEKRPDELSGGERQRIGIATALITDPKIIVADEPVSMLDASVRAEIVNLLLISKEKKNLTYVFITHELDVAYAICDRIGVMYAGRMVELAKTEEIIRRPVHPYTKLLIEAVPPLRPNKSNNNWGKSIDEGECAYYVALPSGCKFQARCKNVKDICKQYEPELSELAPDHFVACYQ
ncbi:MAG: ABC transporter ATP-binding protein [Chloroflexi bacterium]|nr:ABC transporter ATP-binding protein [Chloroflexota bacterium]